MMKMMMYLIWGGACFRGSATPLYTAQMRRAVYQR